MTPHRTAALPALAVLLAAAAGAQPVVTPTPDAPGDLEEAGPYTISNSFETGHRFAEVAGNEDAYRSSVNYGNGLRLFEGELRIHSKEGRGTLFDEFSFNTQGAGRDPYQSHIVRAEKHKYFRYDMQFRIVNYNNRLPSLWNGEQGVNSERIFQNHNLTLFPGSRIEVLLGFDRNKHTGPSFTSQGLNTSIGEFDADNFVRMRRRIRQVNNQYRAGVNFQVFGLAVTFQQALDNYKEDPVFADASQVPGVVDNVQPVERLRRDEPIHGNTPVTSVAIRTEKERLLNFHGRYVYSSGERNFILSEDLAAAGPGAAAPTLRHTFILGDADRKQGTGDLTVTLLPNPKWAVTNTTSINDTRISGASAFLETTVFTNEFVEFEMLDIRHITNSTEVNFRPVPKLSLYGGFHFTTRRIRTRNILDFPEFQFDSELAEQDNDIHSTVGGVRWRPLRGLRMSFDFEVGDADNPFTPIAEREFHNEAARIQWRKNGLLLGFTFKNAQNDNNFSLINHSSTSRQFSAQGAWSHPTGKFTLDANYAKIEINTASGIFNFFDGSEEAPRAANLYISNLHTFYFGSRIAPRERFTFYLGYSISKDTGADRDLTFAEGVEPNFPDFGFDGVNFFNSFPLTYQSPQARLSVRLNKLVELNLGWQFYNYEERFSGAQNFNAHVGYSSLRWTF